MKKKFNADEAALLAAIEADDADAIAAILDHPKLDLNPLEILCAAFSLEAPLSSNSIEMDGYIYPEIIHISHRTMNHFLLHPRIHQAFQSFAQEALKQIWLAATSTSTPFFEPEIMIFKILMPLFKKEPHLTFEEAQALLPGFSSDLHERWKEWVGAPVEKNYFEKQKNMSTYPDSFFFYFGLAVINSHRDFGKIAVPVLDGESENDHFIRCVTTVFKNPLHRAILSLIYDGTYHQYQPLFKLLIESGKVDMNEKDLSGNTPLLIAANDCEDYPELFSTLFTHPEVNINARNKDKTSALSVLLWKLNSNYENATPQTVRFFEKHAHLLFNDPRIDYTLWDDTFLNAAIRTNSIVIFKLIVDHFRRLHQLANFPDPEHNPIEFANHELLESNPQLTAFYAALDMLKNNQHLTCNEVFEELVQQEFPGHEAWEDEHKLKAFYHAQYTLGLFPEHLFALIIFLSDGLLKLKSLNQNTNDLDIHSVVAQKAPRFFTMAGKLPIELQMTLCNMVSGCTKTIILQKKSEPALQALGSKYNNRF